MATITNRPSQQPRTTTATIARPMTPVRPPDRAPLPYRGDWYGLMIWVLGATVLIFLHVVEIVQWLLRAHP